MIVITRIACGEMQVSRVLLPDGRVVIHRQCEDAEYQRRLMRLRSTLGPELCPAVLSEDFEEDVGDVTFREALREGALFVPLAMKIARTIVEAWTILDEKGLAAQAHLGDTGIRFTGSGVRLLVTPAARPEYEDDPTRVHTGSHRLRWMSPETIRGDHRATSMMFGVGMILLEALTGSHPFPHADDIGLLSALMDQEVPPPPEYVPAPIARIIERCTRRMPSDRFSSWTELLTALDDAFVLHPGDNRPMIRAKNGLRIDLHLVTYADFARMRGGSDARQEWVTGVSLDDAKAYAHWAKKRIPDSDEWEAAVNSVGADALGVGTIWELTNSERVGGGWTVRGGPWRDQRGPGQANHLSRSDVAPDVGFRCVADD